MGCAALCVVVAWHTCAGLGFKNDQRPRATGELRHRVSKLATTLPWSGARFHENEERIRHPDWPCCICGKAVTNEEAVWLMSGDGNARFIHPDEVEPGDAGAYPIGPSCLRKYPALKALGFVKRP